MSRLRSRRVSITIEKSLDYDREESRLRSRSVSTTIEKCLDYDREVSRLRSRSVSTTIEKCLDYDREVSRLRSRRFSTMIEKILKKKKKNFPRAEPDPLATAVAQAGIELFTDSSDHPPFPGFETGGASPDYQAYRDSPQHHRFDDSRHDRQRSRSSSPEPPRKMAHRTSSPGPHRSSGPRRPRSRTPRRSQLPDPRGRSPNRPPSWDQVRSMIKESKTRMSSALDRMAQTLETLVSLPPACVTTRRKKIPTMKRRTQATTQKAVSKLRLRRKTRKVSMATPMTHLGTSTTPSTPNSRFCRSSKTTSFSFRMKPLSTMTISTSSESS